MDDRGGLAQPLKRTAPARTAAGDSSLRSGRRLVAQEDPSPSRLARMLRHAVAPVLHLNIPRGVGITATAVVILGSLGYGVVQGDHLATLRDWSKDARDSAANALGFRIVSLALTGNRHISREEVLAIAGVTGNSSLVFLDVEEVRAKLRTNAWIADATVLKLYPDALQIGIKERAAYALWQKDGRVAVIAEDGTVVEPFVAPALLRLPLVVGRGAETRAKEFLDILERYPDIDEQVRASVLVGQRHWNLRLKNGLDVRLPELDVPHALERLATLDRELKLISRDIVSIDLRLPDRVTVKLSPAPAQARAEELKKKELAAKKGGPA
jgi:cell division protein FtsQ